MKPPSFDESDRLHVRARAFVTAFEQGAPMPETFDALACDLARFQAAHHAGYARLCRARGVDVQTLTRASAAPAVPTDSFKLTRVATFPEAATKAAFRTSGTTIGQRGLHVMRDVGTYDAAAVAFGRWALLPDLKEPLPVVVVGPPPEEAPDSSLTHMFELFVKGFGTKATSESTYFLRDNVLDLEQFDDRMARSLVGSDEAVLVLGTSFAFVHLLDGLGDASFRLPPKSRVVQTGGFKGRSREVDAATLRRDIAKAFCIEERAVVAEYGMTELSSQFYEGKLRDPSLHHGVYVEPPWARVTPVDPETLVPVAPGDVGIARIEDLMNVDSAFALLVPDRVRRVPGGFELLGRAPGATPRGCSIATDEMLS